MLEDPKLLMLSLVHSPLCSYKWMLKKSYFAHMTPAGKKNTAPIVLPHILKVNKKNYIQPSKPITS